ncbi:hypothetical protein C7212DRAFT_361232 [Tuber magnatum]|uniref:Uncharacterized protein n=1 Tax=Tuber magnatum TaxID=42249 RepID=A0A317T5E2_9PEZI|nr:hypothetical protein C7212DRAFT_361232 [Tuber magnatum]
MPITRSRSTAGHGLLSGDHQEVINQWFTHYKFSFTNPEDLAARLTQLKRRHKRRRPDRAVPGNCDRLLATLTEISSLPRHRHRNDAANIVSQVHARLTRGTVQTLVPDPRRFGRLPDPGAAISPFADDPVPEVIGVLPRRRAPGEPVPDVSTRRTLPRHTSATPALPAGNEGLIDDTVRWIPETEDFMAAMHNLRTMGANDPGLHAPLLVDHPREVVMNFPETIALITAPVPQIDATLRTAPRSPLTIYDTRAGTPRTQGALTQDHYIYNLIDFFRTKLLEPAIAAKYAIINRAHPSRYGSGSADNIADEPPATVNEVESVMKWILHGFPVIEILREGKNRGGREPIDGCYGYVSRHGPHSHKLFLNSIFFDTIEEAYREGLDYDAIVLLLFATTAHEFGHYLNSSWHVGAARNRYFRTPRGLRYLVQVTRAEDRNDPDFDPDYLLSGEIGQIIEWLLFGFISDIGDGPVGMLGQPLYVTGWGSWPGNNILLQDYACKRLLGTRPHLRMPAPELRVFAENLRREVESEDLGPLGLGDAHEEEVGGPSEPGAPTPENAGREETPEEVEPKDLDEHYEEVVVLADPPDVDARRSGVSIPNTARGKAFRDAFIRLDVEIERARGGGRARRHPNRVSSCGASTGGWGSDPNVRLHNNLNWRTHEIPPDSTGLLSFLSSFDRRAIMVGYIFLCIASDFGLRTIWPRFTSPYSSILTTTVMVLGLFSVRIPDSLTARSDPIFSV